MIRKADINDLSRIVDIHLSGFDGFFLSSLGPGFLKTFYREFLTDGDGLCLVSDEDGVTVGFAAGVLNPSGFFRRTFKKNWPRLALGTLGSIAKDPAIVVKLFRRAFTYPERSPRRPNAVLLSSIAVLPGYHNKKIGERLLGAFLEEAGGMGAEQVILTTDKHGNDRVIRFYQKMGFRITGDFISYEGREMYEFAVDLREDAFHRGRNAEKPVLR